MQPFLDYLTSSRAESGISRGFGFHAFFHAGPVVVILGAALLVLCGFLIAGCLRYRGAILHRVYQALSLVPLAWGIGVFTWRMLEIINTLERRGGVWENGIGEVPLLSETLSEITAVLLTCVILSGIFLALSPLLRPRSQPPLGSQSDSQLTA